MIVRMPHRSRPLPDVTRAEDDETGVPEARRSGTRTLPSARRIPSRATPTGGRSIRNLPETAPIWPRTRAYLATRRSRQTARTDWYDGHRTALRHGSGSAGGRAACGSLIQHPTHERRRVERLGRSADPRRRSTRPPARPRPLRADRRLAARLRPRGPALRRHRRDRQLGRDGPGGDGLRRSRGDAARDRPGHRVRGAGRLRRLRDVAPSQGDDQLLGRDPVGLGGRGDPVVARPGLVHRPERRAGADGRDHPRRGRRGAPRVPVAVPGGRRS